MKVDIMAVGVHPDDIELSAAGTVARHISMGNSVAFLDLTKGELGTRGNAKQRLEEANEAARLLGVAQRTTIELNDGFISDDDASILEVVREIRRYRPEIILCNAISDRHPDHGLAGALVSRAAFLSGLRKIETASDNQSQDAWRPRGVYHYIQDYFIKPDIVVDITPYWETKMKAIKAFASQFYNPDSPEPSSPISGKDFLDFIEGKARVMGRYIGVEYAEGFTVDRPVGVNNLMDIK
jgi:bacillithiol biosynthesis deacetylase BshB1